MPPDRRPSRRSFLGASGLVLGGLIGQRFAKAEPLRAKPVARLPEAPPPAPVNCAVIGLGEQGREILRTLATVPGAVVKAVCDTHQPAHTRALELAPKATPATDFRRVLDRKDIAAVWVATPSHLHTEVALAAIATGKHVYCEAPLAHTIPEARTIASAASRAPKQVFQVGLQRRANPLDMHLLGRVRLGLLDRLTLIEAHHHQRSSWRRAASTPGRRAELDWRLDERISPGLAGEVGIHQFDLVSWFLRRRPISVTAFGDVLAWPDGRKVPDVIHATLTYPDGIRLLYTATLGNSFLGSGETLLANSGAIVMKDNHSWLVKEADAPTEDWEAYAAKETVGKDAGLVLVANATKILQEGNDPAKFRDVEPKSALACACESFLESIRQGLRSAASAQEGFEATVVALTVNEAVRNCLTISFQNKWFDLA